MKTISIAILLGLISSAAKAQSKCWLYVGTYTKTGSQGIYIFKADFEKGIFEKIDSVKQDNPTFLTISPNKNHLYAVSENGGAKPGSVAAYRIDKNTKGLKLLNTVASQGNHPCHITVDKSNKWVAVANYSGGNFSVFRTKADGSLEEAAQTIAHSGNSIVKGRQEKPYAHSATFSPDEKYLVVADLGIDAVIAYPFNKNAQKPIDETNKIVIKTPPGAGPRHIDFHPTAPIVYVLEELSGTVSVYNFSNNNTQLIQTVTSDNISPLPDKGSADIHVSADGMFLYASNRGKANTIAIFSINKKNSQLSLVGYQSTQGLTPRNFAIHPSQKYLLVANQNSNTIEVFKRDVKTGKLSGTISTLQVPMPVCLKILY